MLAQGVEQELDRREGIRKTKPFTAKVSEYIFGESPKKVYNAKILDISQNGVGLILDDELTQGTIVKILMSLPGWEDFKPEFYKEAKVSVEKPLLTLGRVVWSQRDAASKPQCKIGVHFDGIDDGHRMALVDYLKRV